MSTARWTRTGPLKPSLSRLPALGFHLGKDLPQRGGADRLHVADVGADHLVAQVGREHAPGRQHGRDPRQDHAPDLQPARHVGDVQAGGAAEGQEREAAGIDAPADRDQADPLGHPRVDHLVDAVGRGDAVHPEPVGDRVHRALGRGRLEPSPAAQEVAGVQVAQHQVRVGHRRGGAPLAVARGAGVGPRAPGPDLEDAAGVHPARSTPRPRRGSTMSRLGSETRWPATARSTAS